MSAKFVRFALMSSLAGALCSAASAQTYQVRASAYSSTGSQTDSSPFITATGTRVRPGVIAVSRDLLRSGLPHGSRVRVTAQRGCGVNVVGRTLVVEDSMSPRWSRKVDLWFPSRGAAVQFGTCSLTLQKV